MSGRAGRRGIDKRGVVIMIAESRISPDVYKNIAKVWAPYEYGYSTYQSIKSTDISNPTRPLRYEHKG